MATRAKTFRDKLTSEEEDSFANIKTLINKRTRNLYAKDFKEGQFIMFGYVAKYSKNPYDRTPLLFVLGRTRKHTYGINFNWIPPMLRKGIMKMILSKKNLKNIEKGKPVEVPKLLLKKIFRMGVPAFRKYINKRISPKGVVVPGNSYNKLVELRSEHFIGISSEKAWQIAVKKLKQNKKK